MGLGIGTLAVAVMVIGRRTRSWDGSVGSPRCRRRDGCRGRGSFGRLMREKECWGHVSAEQMLFNHNFEFTIECLLGREDALAHQIHADHQTGAIAAVRAMDADQLVCMKQDQHSG